jgi:hypothetical protein
MSRNTPLPFFPVPPEQYDQQYMSTIVQAFSTFLTLYQNPGEGRHTRLVLTNLPENDSGLELGALFQVDGYVKIVQSHTPHPGGNSGTGSVGTVTVTTT